jgi:hypothetical protein
MPGTGGGTAGAGGAGGATSIGAGGNGATGGALGDGGPEALPEDAATDAPTASGPLARGLTLSLIEAAQAVFVPLARAGAEVPAEGRRLELIEGRALFVRASFTTANGFAARPLRALLTVESAPGQAPQVFTDEKTIGAATKAGDLATSFNFLLPATMVTPTARFALSVHEAAAVTTPEPATPPRFPATGTTAFGIKAGKMQLDLVITPAVGPTGTLADSPERRARIERYLFDVYPVQKLNIRWRPLVRLTKKISAADGFTLMRDWRTMDGAKPHEYYHMLVPVEDTSESYLGIANFAGAGQNEGARRIAITFVTKRAIDSELDTISHEMGHNHGRSHVAGCNAQGVDKNYPYANTMVGVSGYALSDGTLKPAPMYKDLMGYCYPTWISDYTFAGFAERVRTVSAFPGAGAVSTAASRSLQAFVDTAAPGGARFAVVEGAVLAAGVRPTPSQFARIVSGGRVLTTGVADQALGDDGRVHELAVDLPLASVDRIEITAAGQSYTLDPASVAGL